MFKIFFKKLLKYLFFILGIVIIGWIFIRPHYFQHATIKVKPILQEGNQVVGLSYQGNTPKGSVIQVTSQTATQIDKDHFACTQLKGLLYDNNPHEWFKIDALEGILKNHMLTLTGGVTVTSYQGIILQTEKVLMNIKKGILTGDSPLNGIMPHQKDQDTDKSADKATETGETTHAPPPITLKAEHFRIEGHEITVWGHPVIEIPQ